MELSPDKWTRAEDYTRRMLRALLAVDDRISSATVRWPR